MAYTGHEGTLVTTFRWTVTGLVIPRDASQQCWWPSAGQTVNTVEILNHIVFSKDH